VGVLFIMLTFVIPKFEDMLASNNQELPDITRYVIEASHFTQAYAFHIIGAMAVLVMLIRRYLATVEGKNFFDAVILKVPLFGDLTKKVAVARFSRTMQTMLSSGINLLDSLDIAKGAVGNNVYSGVVVKIKSEVESGKTLAATISRQPLFPGMMVQMVTVGETAGNLDNMLERVADFYEEEVQNLVGNMTKLLEPIILVVLGGMVAGLMVAMYLPIFKMGG
jgi:type IV pilus assembly protein PilC